ncbi:MAG TPA: hypothetical protein VNG33_20050 [Polyangiaceae bacterium]|nr:hypothetical protein [Polyangiaceae bacterium]
MATSDMFPAEEFGSGSRPTPLIDAPAWLKAQAQREPLSEGDRATLTPYDRAFLESSPTYEEGGSLLPPEPAAPLPQPSTARRVLSLLLFASITGSAGAVLVLAVLRMLGRPLPW